jgi:uncharacterized protein
MYSAANGESLTRDECLWLLRKTTIGRLVFTAGALPAIRPVRFRVDTDTIVIRVATGSPLAHAAIGAVVAFEADEIDPDRPGGWTVVVTGKAELIDSPADLRRVAQLGLESWEPSGPDGYLRIPATVVSGRRMRPVTSQDLCEAGSGD